MPNPLHAPITIELTFRKSAVSCRNGPAGYAILVVEAWTCSCTYIFTSIISVAKRGRPSRPRAVPRMHHICNGRREKQEPDELSHLLKRT